ncbi:T9SS type A sorting domain-containing protein [Parabacteroides goldsteinii]|uniref:T9SS type A sorting domain-containing protein n=1 Tax=Parabacteroides goldsteinii TaxID=328812 RepID=UPI0032C1D313
MKRNKIKYDRWLRMLVLSFTLLMTGGMAVWGQKGPVTDESKRPKITLLDCNSQVELDDGSFMHIGHDSVFHEEKVVYVVSGKERELFIPELRNNIRGGDDERYNWFVHWYVVDKNGKPITNHNVQLKHKQVTIDRSIATLQGGDWSGVASEKISHVTQDYFVKEQNGGLVWSKRIRDNIWKGNNTSGLGGYGMDVSTIEFTCQETDFQNVKIYCDVSFYLDGKWEARSDSDIAAEYTEPTLTKRYVFQLHNAKEIRDKIQDAIPEEFKFEYDYPYSKKEELQTINFTMPYAPDNYFWYVDGTFVQGKKFLYKYEDDNALLAFRLSTRRNRRIPFQQVQRIVKKSVYQESKPIVITVLVSDAEIEKNETDDQKSNKDTDENNGNTKEVAKFIFKPKTNSGFMLDDQTLEDMSERWPRKNKERYSMIGHVDFDNNNVINKDPQKGDNMSAKPFGAFADNWTTYGFLNKNAYTLDYTRIYTPAGTHLSSTSNQNVYGLFRSANKPGVSVGLDLSSAIEGSFQGINWKRLYLWPATNTNYAKLPDVSNRVLYDRTAEVSRDNNEKGLPTEFGYFYYIDASNDAGTLVEVPVDKICQNTELTVTAWVADMTRPSYVDANQEARGDLPLAPNINLFFKGVRADGTEKVLHRFTSCDGLTDYQNKGENNKYVNLNLVKWQQLCYSFVVTENLDEYTNFHLVIQNNEPHTDGADYAIDDIRIFKTKPQVRLVQAGNLCDTEIKSVRFVTNYNVALANLGLLNQLPQYPVTEEEVNNLPENHPFKEWINKQSNKAEVLSTFKKMYYSLYKSDEKGSIGELVKIDYSGDGEGEIYRTSYVSTKPEYMEWTGTGVTEEGLVSSAEIEIKDGELVPNQYYKARLSINPPTEADNVSSPCILVGDPFVLIVADKIYDILDKENSSIELENIRKGNDYTLKGQLSYKESQASTEFKPIENPKFDWFIGDLDEFVASNAITLGGTSYSIKDALIEMNNPDKDKSAMIKKLLIDKFKVYDKDNEPSGRLVLGASSFQYYTIQKYQTVIACASQYQENDISHDKGKLFCIEPVVIPLGGTPPTITPGDPDVPEPDPTDPEDPDNPQPDKDPDTGSHVRSVRVGLIQIQDMAKGGTLRIPIHARKSQENEMFYADKENVDIILRETSDEQAKSEKGKSIATLSKIVDEDWEKATWSQNYFEIKFSLDHVSKMREGFWYMVEIPYGVCDREDATVGTLHSGSFKFTLKIVPEYVTWVGSKEKMHNWNNDDLNHWRRSKNAEIYMSGKNIGAEANGTHPEAYTPMRFTKVTIYGKAKDKDGNYAIDGNAYAAYPHLYKLSKRGTDPTVLLDMAPANMDATIGTATKNIEYDLLADPEFEVELNGKLLNPLGEHSYACVRFYGNACDEIYIKPESEILHTEYLTYNKAHVDYEMDPNRWYMLASPLKGVVSGDMYLPTEESNIGKYARQETPAFGEIYYNNIDYTRWTPAVYMRGWNNSSVNVIYPNNVAQYGVSANWSNLYNDVDVSFAPGIGFSIGTKTTTDDKVLFRLPKADTKYSYYNGAGGSEDSKTLITKNRQGNGRFYFSPNEKGEGEVTSLETNTTGMVGNPFMSHLDMKEFFDINPRSNDTYYILDGNTTITNIAGEKYELSTDSDYDPNYVAPLQSFIKNDLDNKVVFTTAMIAKAPTSGKKVGLRSATAAASEKTLPQLRITASRGGVHNTALVAGLVTASDSYIEGEDAALLINEEVAAPQVYTLAGNQMTAINVTPELKDIPVGIYGKDASPVELSFKLSGDMQNVTLVDKQSGKVYPVTDGLTLTVSGNTSGRYFLNGSIATSNEVIARNEIVCYANGNGQIVVSSVDPLTRISVYSVSGQRLRYLDNLNMQTVYVKDLAPGIYIVKAESVTQVCSEKMEVK